MPPTAPPAPEPTTIALVAGTCAALSTHFGDDLFPASVQQPVDDPGRVAYVELGPLDLSVGVAPRLGVPRELAGAPTDQSCVAAVLRVGVHRLDGVTEHQ